MSSQPTDRRPGREEEQREECELLEEGPMKAGYPTRGTLAWPRSQELGEKMKRMARKGSRGVSPGCWARAVWIWVLTHEGWIWAAP